MERPIKEQVGEATWESWPIGARMVIADAQATIAALQAKVSELQGIADEKCRCFLERAEQSEKQLTRRTAELERVRGERDEYAHKTKMLCLQNGPLMIENHDMKKLIAALPKVEGEINERFCTGSYYSSPRDYRTHVTFEAALVALLKHRQGMEGV